MKNISTIMKKLAEKLHQLNKEYNTDQEPDVEVLAFGLRLIVLSLLNYILILGLAYLLNIFTATLAAVIVGSSLKVFSGGAHANSPIKCLLLGTLTYLIIGQSSVLLGNLLEFNYPFWVAVGVIAYTSVHTFAPAPAKNKPIQSMLQRRKLRNISRMVTGMALGITFFLALIGTGTEVFYGVLLGLLWQSISLWPGTYKVMEKI